MGTLLSSPEALIGTAVEAKQIVVQVAVGSEHGILLSDAGICFTWGDNRYGQLGRTPRLMEEGGRPFPVTTFLDREVTQVAAGVHHCLALCAPGLVWAWGRNKAGQLGCCSNNDKVVPERVSLHTDTGDSGEGVQLGTDDPIISIGAGGSSSVAASLGSSVWQWGEISTKFTDNDRAIVKNRPHAVFRRDKFLPHLQKAARRDSGNALPVSITATAGHVLTEGSGDMDIITAMADGIRQLRAAIATERDQLSKATQRRREQVSGKDGGSELNAVQDLQISIAVLQRDVERSISDIKLLEKSLKSMEVKQEQTRVQLNTAMQQGVQLEVKQDEVSQAMFETDKHSADRKKLHGNLQEIRKYIDANVGTREILLETKSEADKEKQRLQFGLHDKRQALDKSKRKLTTLQDLSRTVTSTFNEADALFKFLQERKGDFDRREREAREKAKQYEFDFVNTMAEFTNDDAFLGNVEARIRDISGTESGDQVKAARARLVCDLLQDLVNLRRYWNDLRKDKWQKEDLDFSTFLAVDKGEKKKALKGDR